MPPSDGHDTLARRGSFALKILRVLMVRRNNHVFPVLKILGILALSVLAATPALAQSNVSPGTIDTGFPTNGVYYGSKFDSVQINNGNLHIEIPIVVRNGRGDSITYKYVYDSKNTSLLKTLLPLPAPAHFRFIGSDAIGYGSGYSVQRVQCGKNLIGNPVFGDIYSGYFLVKPDGTRYSSQVQFHFAPGVGDGCTTTSPGGFVSFPEGWTMQIGTPGGGNLAPSEALKPDGTIITLDPSSGTSSQVTDRNGNIVNCCEDTLGRSTVIEGTNGPTYNDSTGTLQTVQVTRTNVPIIVYNCKSTSPNTVECTPSSTPGSWSQLQTVQLPNGQSFQLQYVQDEYGEPSSLTLPDGAQISWTYGASDGGGPKVTSRTITVGGKSSTWTFTYGFSGSVSPTTTWVNTVVDPVGNETDYTCLPPPNSDGATSDPGCLVSEVQYKQGSGQVIKTVVLQYSSYSVFQAGFPPFPISMTTTWNQQNLVSQRQIDWHLSPDAPSEVREYDYGTGSPGLLLRRTDYTYLDSSNSSYSARNMLVFPTSKIVYDGGGNIVSQTKYAYDSTAPTTTTGAPNHDYTNYGSSFNTRANLTQVSRWRNTDGTWLTTSNTYDDLGNLLTVTDPNVHITKYSYKDNWGPSPNNSCVPSGDNTQAFVTQITNVLGQLTQMAYYPCTSLLYQSKDQNDINASRAGTTYTYDLLDRSLTVAYADGGSVTDSYNDVAPVSVSVSKALTSSTAIKTTTVFDGLGRAIQTQLTSDPSGTDFTDTTYDALGHVASTSNSYRTKTDPTYGLTTYTYDPLDRTTQVTHPDSSKIVTAYAGRATEVTDEGNGTKSVQRISQTDGLGRLASVCEVTSATQLGTTPTPAACGQDIAGTGFLTTYQYDTLDNLIKVNQGGLTARTFAYDSLSQLTSATNPESGVTTYTYDADSNMITRTQPAPNQTSASETVTTSYTYDQLNRMTTKQYSDDTDNVEYNYDETSPFGFPLTNQIGRLTTEYDLHTGSVFSYDPMGRVVQNHQCTPQNCGTADFPIAYTYDLAGDLLTSTDGQFNTYTRTYNAAAQLTSLASSFSDSNHPGTLFSTAVYNAPGEMTSGKLGNGITETRAYNSRLEMTSASAGSVYSLSLGYAPNGDVTSANDKINGNWTYTYDDFNRLATANATGKAYTYGYDRFGNRWNQELSGSCTSGSAICLTFDANNHINNGVEAYDAAGNLMSDGFHNYFYDAEHHLIQVDGSGGWCASGTGTAATACYTYDAEGRRVRRSVPGDGITDDYLYDLDGHFITQMSGQGSWVRGEIYAGGTHIATYENDLTTPTTFFTHADHLGTERVETGVSGASCETTTSLPFGDGLNTSGSCDPTQLRFTGKQRDFETNLDNFGARYDASSLGRFMTADWSSRPTPVPFADLSNPQSLNLYSYVANNSTSRVDPLGHNWFYLDGKWQWHKGKQYTYNDANGNGQTITSNITALLIARATGTNPNTGATTFKLTLYDQNKKVFEGTGFSGGGGNPAIKDGNYIIRLDIRDPNGPNTINPNSPLNNPPAFYGIQRMHDITDANGTWGVVGAYGPIRARLNPWPGQPDGYDYFHGQSNGYGYTHGCLCYGTDTRIINYMWNNMGATRVGVSVDTPVGQP